MRLLTALIIALFLCSCSGGGSGNSNSGGAITPGGDIQQGQNTITGTYCCAYTTVGVDEGIIRDAVSYLDSVAPVVQEFTNEIDFSVTIVFDGTEAGYYQGDDHTIHLSSNTEAFSHRLPHEYAHACTLAKKGDELWVLEIIAKATEEHLGVWTAPASIPAEYYDQLICDDVEFLKNNQHLYTIWAHFAAFLMTTYQPGVIRSIVQSPLTGKAAITQATGESWDTIMERWRSE